MEHKNVGIIWSTIVLPLFHFLRLPFPVHLDDHLASFVVPVPLKLLVLVYPLEYHELSPLVEALVGVFLGKCHPNLVSERHVPVTRELAQAVNGLDSNSVHVFSFVAASHLEAVAGVGHITGKDYQPPSLLEDLIELLDTVALVLEF